MLNYMGVDREELLMIGDRTSDLEAAREIDCAFIGCNYGFASEEIKTADKVIHDFSELLEIL